MTVLISFSISLFPKRVICYNLLFEKKFLRLLFAPLSFAPPRARARAHIHTYIYIKHYVCGIFAPTAHTPQARPKNALFVRLQFLIKDFCKIVCLFGFKFITLHADTRSDDDTNETNAAKCIHAHGYNRNEMRALLVI